MGLERGQGSQLGIPLMHRGYPDSIGTGQGWEGAFQGGQSILRSSYSGNRADARRLGEAAVNKQGML